VPVGDDIVIGPYSLGCPPNEPVDAPALPEGEHPSPLVVAEEFRDTPRAQVPPRHTHAVVRPPGAVVVEAPGPVSRPGAGLW